MDSAFASPGGSWGESCPQSVSRSAETALRDAHGLDGILRVEGRGIAADVDIRKVDAGWGCQGSSCERHGDDGRTCSADVETHDNIFRGGEGGGS